jgi:two-component system, NarL family, sensor histidine kinase DesK
VSAPPATARPALDADDPFSKSSVNLVYLVFVLLPLVFDRSPHPLAWPATLLAMALFLGVYFPAFRGSLGPDWLGVGVLAAIGYALLPFNLGGNTFLIYAMALAGSRLPPRNAILSGVLLLWLMLGELLWLVGPRIEVFAYTLLVAVIGGMVITGVLYSRLQRRRLAELRLSQDEVRRLAAVAERERIARDLHDLLGHTLSVVALKSELAGKLLGRDPQAAREQIDEVARVAREALGQVREAVNGFRRGGLLAELAAARLALLGAEVELEAPDELPTLHPDDDGLLALCLREACTNVLRHAEARRVTVELAMAAGLATLRISDDGRGGIGQYGNGLTGMAERLQARGGTLQVASTPGRGTQLQLQLPLNTPITREAAP